MTINSANKFYFDGKNRRELTKISHTTTLRVEKTVQLLFL